jgi:pimeloyl-ACP methyl ester carboxylesterase
MSQIPAALWLHVNPALQRFDRPLLNRLSQDVPLACWEYCQTPDEPTALEVALTLLHDYLKHHDRPIHLLGHSTSGLLGLLYANRHPERVRSLTLLSVGVYPAVDWQAHYYTQLHLIHCSRKMLLTQTAYTLLGCQSHSLIEEFVSVLEHDLLTSLSPHTLYQRFHCPPIIPPVPLLVCGSQDDVVIDPNSLQGWQPRLKDCDRLWQCPNGRYFFHYFQPKLVSQQIRDFWFSLEFHVKESLQPSPTV